MTENADYRILKVESCGRYSSQARITFASVEAKEAWLADDAMAELAFLRQLVQRAEPLIQAYADHVNDPDAEFAAGNWLDLYGHCPSANDGSTP